MRLIPTFLSKKNADPTGGMTLEALVARQKALQEQAPKTPAQIASPWQGAALMADTFVNSLQQKQAAEQEEAGRTKLAQAIGGINYDTGATPEQTAAISQLDPELGYKFIADTVSARRQAAQQAHADEMTRAGWAHQDTAAEAARAHDDAMLDARTDRWDDYVDPRNPTKLMQRNARTGEVKEKGAQTRVTSADLKSQYAQEDEVVGLDNTLKNLSRAVELNEKVPVGRIGQAQATMHGNLPGWLPGTGTDEAADASKEFWQIMDEQAITQMSAALKGATTDTELAQFKQILSDPSSSVQVRRNTIDRMMALAQRKRDVAAARLNDIKGTSGTDTAATPLPPSGAPAPGQVSAPAPAAGPAAPAIDVTKIPEQAVLDLKNDPSGAAEFDAIFGAGAAAKILGTGGAR